MSYDASIEQPSTNYPARNTQAFTSVYSALRNALCAFAFTFIKCKHAAEDIVSNVFIILWEKSLKFDRFEKIQAWLYKCTQRACGHYIKRNKYDFMPQSTMESLLTDEDGPHDMPWEEALTQIVIAVKKLPVQRRRVFTLYCVQSKDMGTVATMLKISRKTAYNHKFLAVEFIRKHLQQHRLHR